MIGTASTIPAPIVRIPQGGVVGADFCCQPRKYPERKWRISESLDMCFLFSATSLESCALFVVREKY